VTDRLVGGVTEEHRGRRVPAGHALVGVHDDDRGRADLDEHLEVLLLAIDLGEEPRVLDGDAHVGRDRREQAGIRLAEPPSSAMLCTLIAPIALLPTRIGTPRYDSDGVPRLVSSSCCSRRFTRSGSRDWRIWVVRPSPYVIGASGRRSPLSQ
jgi:hypothetical protein